MFLNLYSAYKRYGAEAVTVSGLDRMNAVDLYCGSGGLSAGLINSGIDILAAYDNWPTAVETYKRNIDDRAFIQDLSDIDTTIDKVSSAGPDILVGGPPCQDFSTAGKRTEGDRANLTVAFGEVVKRCNVDCFLMENVPQARLSKAFKEVSVMLKKSGYFISQVVLDSSHCGVPQSRKRFFAFGCKNENSAVKFLNWVNANMSKEKLTVKNYLKDDIDIEFYYRHPRNYSRRSVFSVNEPSPTIRGVNRPVPPNYERNHLDSADPSSVRPLTTWERSRIQTFSKEWKWSGGNRNADVELQIGNAVPVNLAEYVGKGICHATE